MDKNEILQQLYVEINVITMPITSSAWTEIAITLRDYAHRWTCVYHLAFYLPTFAEIHFLSSVHCKIVHTVYFQLSLAFLQ